MFYYRCYAPACSHKPVDHDIMQMPIFNCGTVGPWKNALMPNRHNQTSFSELQRNVPLSRRMLIGAQDFKSTQDSGDGFTKGDLNDQ